MSTDTYSTPSPSGFFAFITRLLLFVAVLIVIILAISTLQPVEIHTTQPVNKPGGYSHSLPEIQIVKHGWDKHNMEALAAELCGASYGISQVRFQKKTNRFLLLCEDLEGNVFVQVIEKIKTMLYEQKTAFRYTNQTTGEPMTWNEVMQYLDKFTTRWTGQFP